MSYRQKTVQCLSPSGLHRLAYREWGHPDRPRVLICVHGLTRNGRDFDRLAAALSDEWRVICPDIVGRGDSDWLSDPLHYALPQYLSDLITLIARLDVERVDWLGTSMGGLIGMLLASQPGSPIERLILNDVGPWIPAAALQRLATYVGRTPVWSSPDVAERYFREIHASFGALSDADWRQLAHSSIVEREDGTWAQKLDPAIAIPFHAQSLETDVDLWAVYERISCATLALRGAHSDLLTSEAWRQMGQRGPRARLIEYPDAGHAPMLATEAQIEPIRAFLSEARTTPQS